MNISLQPTYEELKLDDIGRQYTEPFGLQPTYEELKLYTTMFFLNNRLAFVANL